MLDDKSIKELYGYYKNNPLSNYLSPVTKLHYKRLLDDFERYRKNNSIIDVGCGAGYFMLCASESGWGVDGTEISCEAIKLAEEKGQKVIRGDIASIELEKEKYDVATLFEIMEHASDPDGIIRKLSWALRQEGALYITTPNYNSITRRFLGNKWGIFYKEHLFYFTIKELSSLLKKYNFKIKVIKSENLSLREVLKIFKGHWPVDEIESYKKQECLRNLAEESILCSLAKKLINFILNIFKAGDTIYILAEK